MPKTCPIEAGLWLHLRQPGFALGNSLASLSLESTRLCHIHSEEVCIRIFLVCLFVLIIEDAVECMTFN